MLTEPLLVIYTLLLHLTASSTPPGLYTEAVGVILLVFMSEIYLVALCVAVGLLLLSVGRAHCL